MSDEAKKNGEQSTKPAYTKSNGQLLPFGGLTKREYFAAMAMQGLLANPKTFGAQEVSAAHDAVMMADALLAALEENNG